MKPKAPASAGHDGFNTGRAVGNPAEQVKGLSVRTNTT
ncbi:hypothetical protein I552_0602 [Mycobacterium xenopi 3993]|nr:hypothetical protein I552_0602 [Mycobacterium xenopi 3993]